MNVSPNLRYNFLCSSVLVSLSLVHSGTMFGMKIDDFTNALSINSQSPLPHLVVEKDFDFAPNPQLLAQDHMQIAVKMLNPDELRDSPHAGWDIDGVHASLGSDDITMLTRSAVIIRNKEPQFFTFEQITAPDYLAVAFYDTKNEPDSDDEAAINCSRSYFTFTINTKIKFQTYDLTSGEERYMDATQKAALLANAPMHDGLEMITSSFSLPGDVSLGSYGGRTANYYYRLNATDTLHISQKLVTIKKESRYSFFAVRFLHIWDNIIASAPGEQQQGSWRNIVNIRAYQKH